MRTDRKAFTLVEVLITVSLIGVIMAGAVAPLVLMVNSLNQVESDYSRETALHRTISLIFRDLRSKCASPSGVSAILKRRDIPGDIRRDILLFWTCNPSGYSSGAGTIVYMIHEGNWGEKAGSSLYRWFIPSVLPDEVNYEDLGIDSQNSQLLLPDVGNIAFSAWDGSVWSDSYQGIIPAAVRVSIKRNNEELTLLEWIPR